MRGRVLAVDRATQIAIVRGERADARIDAPSEWRPGDLVDGDRVVRAFDGDFPAPATETMRIPRARITNPRSPPLY
jgi:hypothetical protein